MAEQNAAPTSMVHRGDAREHHHADDILGRFSFPFAGNFDLTKRAHGALLVHNDDVIAPRAGVDRHQHAEMEIVTWIVDGELEHNDTAGNSGRLTSGMLQRMSAGTGLLHAEHNVGEVPLRVVQMWVPPTTAALAPDYAQADLNDALATGRVVTALSGRRDEDAGIGIANVFVSLDVARPHPDSPVTFRGAPFHHLFVSRGTVRVTTRDAASRVVGAHELEEGDALRATNVHVIDVAATGTAPSEVLTWRMHAHF